MEFTIFLPFTVPISLLVVNTSDTAYEIAEAAYSSWVNGQSHQLWLYCFV